MTLEPKDFQAGDGETLAGWQNVDQFTWRAYFNKGEKLLGSKSWAGPQPKFLKLYWQAEPR